ncbi:MAG TPA: MBL fold metallo-hydrolase [Candidatus Dormibacteraeota bacterium]|nr:MBL fold metallo-hydrolase [Candidatus Dormibacteraeota bacterium]
MAAADTWQELAPGVFRLAWEPFRLNVGLVVGQERALVVDTGASLDAGQAIVKLAMGITELPLEALNSHSHFDHCFGNGALEAHAIWSHRLCAEHLRWDGEVQQREVIAQHRVTDQEFAVQVAKSPIISGSCLVDDEVDLDLGGRIVTLVHPGRGHTDNDTAAWIADDRILFAGDLLEEGAPPSFEDSFPLEWPDTLAVLLALDPDQIVPGHGAVVDCAFARGQHADLQQLAALSRQGFKNFRRPGELDGNTAFAGHPAQTAIRRAYTQLAAANSGAWAERQPG